MDRQQAHRLIDQLSVTQFDAVARLLEVMVHEDNGEDEEIGAEEEAAVARSKEWFKHHQGIPFEQIVADLGFTMDQIRGNSGKDPAA